MTIEKERKKRREIQGVGAGERAQRSHSRAAWKLNGVPFPCRDCHFRFLYLYKSQSKPNTCQARKRRLCLSVCACVCVHVFLWQPKKVKNTEKRP